MDSPHTEKRGLPNSPSQHEGLQGGNTSPWQVKGKAVMAKGEAHVPLATTTPPTLDLTYLYMQFIQPHT